MLYIIVQFAAPGAAPSIIALWGILPFLATQFICHVMPIIADMFLKRNYLPIARSSSIESVNTDNVTIERICADEDLRVAFLMYLQTYLDASSLSFIVDVSIQSFFNIHHIYLAPKEKD